MRRVAAALWAQVLPIYWSAALLQGPAHSVAGRTGRRIQGRHRGHRPDRARAQEPGSTAWPVQRALPRPSLRGRQGRTPRSLLRRGLSLAPAIRGFRRLAVGRGDVRQAHDLERDRHGHILRQHCRRDWTGGTAQCPDGLAASHAPTLGKPGRGRRDGSVR